MRERGRALLLSPAAPRRFLTGSLAYVTPAPLVRSRGPYPEELEAGSPLRDLEGSVWPRERRRDVVRGSPRDRCYGRVLVHPGNGHRAHPQVQ